MSRAFVKEQDDVPGVAELPDRPISPLPNMVTAEGLAALEADYARLQRDHAGAQAAGDRAMLASLARDLRYFAARRACAQVAGDAELVHFGSRVTIDRPDGRRQSFRIVGEDEADPSHGTLSHAAPLARALAGKKVGDVVVAGNAEAEIVAIE
jgi:transcription elongation GreA/GreB family factor